MDTNDELIELGKAVQRERAKSREPVELLKDDDPAHADLALSVIADIYSPGSDTKPVLCGGQWWAYKAERGVWVRVDKSVAKRSVLDLRHFVFWTSPKGDPRKAVITSAKLDSIYKMMKITSEDNEFFNAGTTAICFRNKKTVLFSNTCSKVKDYSPGYLSRSYYDFDFDAKKGTPHWDAFLESVFAGDEDADDKRNLLREFIGACLRGEATYYEKVLLLLGTGRNGKSIFCDVVAELFKGTMCSIPPQDLSDTHHLVALESASLNLVSDIPVRGFKDSGGFKQVVSGDPVTARRLYADHYTFKPTAGHIFSANDLPRSPDTSAGFYRRWVIIQFNRTFGKEDSVPREVLLRNLKSELPGIVVWALQGARELRKRGGFLVPSSNGAIIEEWSADNNQVQQFTLDACVHVPDGHMWTSVQELYNKYRDWSQENGHCRMSAALFRQRLDKLHFKRRLTKHGAKEYNIAVKPKSAWFSGRSEANTEREDDLLTRLA